MYGKEKSNTLAPKDAFNNIILDAINQTLSSLGKTRKRKVFLYLKKELGIDRQDVPFRLAEFSRAIETVLPTEAFNFKTKLLIEIQRRFEEEAIRPKNFDCLVPNLTFEDYIQIKQLLFLLAQKNSISLRANIRLPMVKEATP
jgi:hypothetical protein